MCQQGTTMLCETNASQKMQLCQSCIELWIHPVVQSLVNRIKRNAWNHLPTPFCLLQHEDAENIGYVIPTPVMEHFINDYERNGQYTAFPALGIEWQKMESPFMRTALGMQVCCHTKACMYVCVSVLHHRKNRNVITPSGMGQKCLKLGHIGVPCGALVMFVHALQLLDDAMEMPYLLRLKDECGLLQSTMSVPTGSYFLHEEEPASSLGCSWLRTCRVSRHSQMCTDEGVRQQRNACVMCLLASGSHNCGEMQQQRLELCGVTG